MPNELFIVLPVGLAILVAAFCAALTAPRLGVAVRALAALVFAPLALFCVYGFAASMEPGDYHFIWRMVYPALFLACSSAVMRLVFAKSQHSKVE